MEPVLILICAILLFALLVLLASGGALFLILCGRKDKIVKKMLAEGEGEMMRQYGTQIDAGRSKFKELNKREITIKSHDNLTLYGYFVEGNVSDRTIICVHGYRGSPVHDFGPAIENLLNFGNLLLIDQRAHGKSEGKYVTFGVRECQDCKAWADYVAKTMGDDHPVYFDGVSMGGTTVLLASSLELPKNVKGIIADCSYTSPHEILKEITEKFLKTNTDALLFSADIYCRIFAGFSLNQMSTKNAVQQNRVPILFAHGMCDSLVPHSMTQAAFDNCNTKKFLVLSEKAEHGMSYMVDFEQYNNAILELFKECENTAI